MIECDSKLYENFKIYLSLQPKPEYIIPEHIMDLKKYHRSGLCPSHSPSKECPDYRICDKDFDCLYNFKCCKGCCVRAKRPSNQFKFKASGEVKSAEKFSFH